MEKYWKNRIKLCFLLRYEQTKIKRNTTPFSMAWVKEPLFVLIELKWCGDYLPGELRAFSHYLFSEGRTRDKIQVMEFQCDNWKHAWWSVLSLLTYLQKSMPVFHVISCNFDNNLASSVPMCPPCISFLSLSSGSACLSWAVNQARVEGT